MKTLVILVSLTFMLFSPALVKAQKKSKKYVTWVTFMEKEGKVKGWLSALKDSSIVMESSTTGKLLEFRIEEIKTLKFRKKGKITRGALIGLGTGVVTGAIAGQAEGDDVVDYTNDPWGFSGIFAQTADEKSRSYAVSLGVLGAGLGAGLGAIKKKFRIEGRLADYHLQRESLKKYVSSASK